MLKKMTIPEMIGQLIMHAIMILAVIICLYPVILTLMVSFTDEVTLMRNGMQLIPEVFSLDAYRLIFANNTVGNAYLVTITVTVIGTALSLLICGMAGFAMSLNTLKYRNIAALFFYIPMVFNAGLLPWFLVSTQLYGLTNRFHALIIPLLVSSFNVFLMRNYFKTISPSLIESAQMDGCGAFRIFITIVMPLSAPVIATVSLFIGLTYWNDWTMALWFINNPRMYPLQYMLFQIRAIMDQIRMHGTLGGHIDIPSQTYQVATLFVTIGPIVLLYPFVQRYFVKGIMIGAVKG